MSFEFSFTEIGMSLVIILISYLAYMAYQAKQYRTRTDQNSTSNKFTMAPNTNGAHKLNKSNSQADDSKLLPLTIFYGTQSGTSETFAHELSEECKIYGFKGQVVDLEDYDKDTLCEEQFCVFLMSTFGEGDPTDNAIEFYNWLMNEEREKGSLNNVLYAVFALGNKQYEHFCKIGRDVDRRLHELGGQRLLEHGEGDDDGSLEDDYINWKGLFWNATKKKYGLHVEDTNNVQVFKPSFVLEYKNEEFKYNGGLSPAICDPKHKPILATCVANRELRNQYSDEEQTRHVDLDVSSLRLSYTTADNLGVCPRNDIEAVKAMAQRLKVKLNSVFSLKVIGKKKSPLPSPCSIQDALLWYCDFQAIPRPTLLTTLQQYTNDEAEKQKLHSWTHELKDEYHNDQKSLYEVLEELPGLNIPFLDFIEWCPKIQPRFYTISSSSLVHPKQVSVTVSLSVHHKPRGRIYWGLASTYLCNLKPSDKICVFLRPSTFRLPKPKRVFIQSSTSNPSLANSANGTPSPSPSPSPPPLSPQALLPPIIMVGPGTGVAPFHAFLQEFQSLKERNLPSFPATHLYFGCRHSSNDWIYKDEMMLSKEKGYLTELYTAFSRDQEKKIYVQDHLKQNGEQLWTLISQQRAYFYVCGGTLMGRQVKECILHMAETYGLLTNTQAQEYLKKMQTDGRYIQELWS